MKALTYTALALALACTTGTALAGGDKKQLDRGKYLVNTGGCHDCHTPLVMGENGPVPDFSRALSGHPAGMALPPPPKAEGPWLWGGAASMTAFWGPWGTTYSANITSDKDTGIGSWRVEDFVKMARTGRHLGVGRPILPPMPWASLSAMSDSDLHAMFAYLQSTTAIANKVPEAVINPPPAAKP